MKRLALILVAIVFIALVSPPMAAAQTTQPGQSGQQGPDAKPESSGQPTQTPAAQPPASNAATVNPAPASTETKPKKIWTNEDVGGLREGSVITTFNTPKPAPAKPRKNSATPQGGRDAKWYRSEIQKLQAQIPPLDDKIAKLQDAIDGKQVDEVRHYTWSRPDDWRDQLARLEKQREEIQGKIASLLDEARHRGIPAEQLP
jgi:hypothetical protein